jgi:hypothetical protein
MVSGGWSQSVSNLVPISSYLAQASLEYVPRHGWRAQDYILNSHLCAPSVSSVPSVVNEPPHAAHHALNGAPDSPLVDVLLDPLGFAEEEGDVRLGRLDELLHDLEGRVELLLELRLLLVAPGLGERRHAVGDHRGHAREVGVELLEVVRETPEFLGVNDRFGHTASVRAEPGGGCVERLRSRGEFTAVLDSVPNRNPIGPTRLEPRLREGSELSPIGTSHTRISMLGYPIERGDTAPARLSLGIRRATLATLVLAGAAHADLTFNLAPAPGGFVQACAGPATNGIPWPGSDFFLSFIPNQGANLVEEPFTGDSLGDLTASFSGSGVSNSAHAVAGLGFFHGSATNSAPDAAYFPMGVAHGGWSENFVIANPALTGQPGFMQFTLHVEGTLFATGLTGSSTFVVTAYKDTVQLATNQFFDPGNSDPISTSAQYGNWGVATFGNPPTDGKTVNDTVTFAVPFTFGTPFKLGVYAIARAGMRSSGGQGGNSSSQTNFEDGLHWGGITQIYLGTTPTTGYTITSGSGIDWSQPVGGGNPADLDGNGSVNAADLAILLGGWGTTAGDINGDGTTNAADLAELLGAWG